MDEIYSQTNSLSLELDEIIDDEMFCLYSTHNNCNVPLGCVALGTNFRITCTVKSAVSDLCCRRPSTVSDRFSVHRRFHIQTDLSRATICCARPATAISCTVAAFKSAVSDRDPGSERCETVLASALSTAKCENALSCKCDRLAPGLC